MANNAISEAEFSLQIKGKMLVIKHLNKRLLEIDLSATSALAQRFNDAGIAEDVVETGDALLIHKSKVREFVEVYKGIIYKYTRIKKTYPETGKYWQSFVKATKTAIRMGVPAPDYINAVLTGYSEFNKESTVNIPWPAQLHGDAAEQFVIKYCGTRSQTALEGDQARKLAHANKNVPLNEDDKYQRIKNNIRKKLPYTMDDLEYCSARQIQCEGREAPWVSNYRECLRIGKESNED